MASATMDVDPSETTSVSQPGSASQHEMHHDATNLLLESRSIRVVLYGTSPAETEHKFWVDPQVTFGSIEKALAEMYPSQTVVALEAHWGPRPYWTESHPLSPIGATCQCLYALLSSHTRAYILAVVRTSLTDYPIPIYETPPESFTTLFGAVLASNPKLTGQIRSISHYFDDRDIRDVPYDNDFIASHPPPTTSTTAVLITTLDEPPKDFLVGSLYEYFSPSSPKASTSGDLDGLIPPFLQISFVECKLLVQHSYELDLFPLQMVHLSKAILHVIISLARNLETAFGSDPNIGALTANDRSADLLPVAPLLSRQLEGFLDTANEILQNIRSGTCDQREVQRRIESIFDAICGDFPGAVTVRCSAMHFKKLASIDNEDLDAQSPHPEIGVEAIGGIDLDMETQSSEETGSGYEDDEDELDDEGDEKHDAEDIHDNRSQVPAISTSTSSLEASHSTRMSTQTQSTQRDSGLDPSSHMGVDYVGRDPIIAEPLTPESRWADHTRSNLQTGSGRSFTAPSANVASPPFLHNPHLPGGRMFKVSANVYVNNALELLWFLLNGTPPTVHRPPEQGIVSRVIAGFLNAVTSSSTIPESPIPQGPSVSAAGISISVDDIKQKKSPPLFAFVVGIDKYASARIPTLKGAVNDAKAIKGYLESELNVPSHQIKTLYNAEATRDAIIQELEALQEDPRIKKDDPIVFFFAGHGTTEIPPEHWDAGGPEIQMIAPYDSFQMIGETPISPIPDHKLGVLLKNLAEKKGDNLTVILDCCHSRSGTRDLIDTGSTLETDRSVRGFDFKEVIPPQLDNSKWRSKPDDRGAYSFAGSLQIGLGSHVLLAACTAQETAKEEGKRGRFTRALLGVLYAAGADKLTYAELIKRIPALPEQNPQCEGHNQDRILFDCKAPSQHRQLFRVQMEDGQIVLQAGAAHGVTPGAIFSVYKDRDAAVAGLGTGDTIGSLTALDPEPFSTKMAITSGHFSASGEAFALQTRAGEVEDLRIHVPFDERLLCVFEAIAKEMTTPQQRLALVEEATAALSVALEDDGKIAFNIRDPLVTAHGLNRIPYRVNRSSEDLCPIIRAAAHYHWHLHRTSKERLLKDKVKVEFTKVIDSDYDEDLNPIYRPEGPSLVVDGVVDLIADRRTLYGIKITNNLNVDLYLSAFFFDNSDFSITPYYQPGTSGGKVQPSVLGKQSLTIGFGAGGAPPASYSLDEGQNIDVGFVKIFLSTEQVDLSHVRQASPFGPDHRHAIPVRKKPKAAWDTILITIVQRRAK